MLGIATRGLAGQSKGIQRTATRIEWPFCFFRNGSPNVASRHRYQNSLPSMWRAAPYGDAAPCAALQGPPSNSQPNPLVVHFWAQPITPADHLYPAMPTFTRRRAATQCDATRRLAMQGSASRPAFSDGCGPSFLRNAQAMIRIFLSRCRCLAAHSCASRCDATQRNG